MIITAKFAGACRVCQTRHTSGARVWWMRGERGVCCLVCMDSMPARAGISSSASYAGSAARSSNNFSSRTWDQNAALSASYQTAREAWQFSDVLGIPSTCILCGWRLAPDEEVLINARREPICLDSCRGSLPALDIAVASDTQIEERIAVLHERYMASRYG